MSILFIFHYIILKLAEQSQFIPVQNVVYFITLPFLDRKIFTFYINDVLIFKCRIPRSKGYNIFKHLSPPPSPPQERYQDNISNYIASASFLILSNSLFIISLIEQYIITGLLFYLKMNFAVNCPCDCTAGSWFEQQYHVQLRG